jgi:hypothetical protein
MFVQGGSQSPFLVPVQSYVRKPAPERMGDLIQSVHLNSQPASPASQRSGNESDALRGIPAWDESSALRS